MRNLVHEQLESADLRRGLDDEPGTPRALSPPTSNVARVDDHKLVS
jgi:hypothetical protein